MKKNDPAYLYDIKVKTIHGEEIELSTYHNKVLLIVNVASQCGFTPQYQELQCLYENYQTRGFEILGFPCNQFGHQEPGDEAEIKSFCTLHYHITFPLFSKIEVNGPHTHPLYTYLKKQAKGLFQTEAIKWNFTKFLVNRKGEAIARYAPSTSPKQLISRINAIL